jgi:TRAP-type transport system periplasmic protein
MRIRFAAVIAAAAFGAAAFTTAIPAQAQQNINLTIGSSHPVTLPFIAAMKDFMQPEVNRRLEKQGSKHRIVWREAYGGVLYKANATLTSVQDGIVDIGWVFTVLEASRMPLHQVSNYTPGVTQDPYTISKAFNELSETPVLKAEWDKYNLIPLGAMSADALHLFTKFPVKTVADLKGKRLSASGTIGVWLQGSGAIPVDGALPSFYNDIKTGVTDGAFTIATGVMGVKIYEVAPYVTRTSLGTIYAGAIAINKNSYAKLPPDVQKVLHQVGRDYSAKNGEMVKASEQMAYKLFAEAGKKQKPPVVVTELPAAEQAKWLQGAPNLAQDWVKSMEAKGLPGGQVLKEYMAAMRKAGARPVRDWDKQ